MKVRLSGGEPRLIGLRVEVELEDGTEFLLTERHYEDGMRLEITGGLPAHELAVLPQMANVIQLVNEDRSLR